MSRDTRVKNKKCAACGGEVILVKPIKEITKTFYIWHLLSQPAGLNRLEAAEIGEHHLSATVSNLRASGRLIDDEWVINRTRAGTAVCVKRYWAKGG